MGDFCDKKSVKPLRGFKSLSWLSFSKNILSPQCKNIYKMYLIIYEGALKNQLFRNNVLIADQIEKQKNHFQAFF